MCASTRVRRRARLELTVDATRPRCGSIDDGHGLRPGGSLWRVRADRAAGPPRTGRRLGVGRRHPGRDDPDGTAAARRRVRMIRVVIVDDHPIVRAGLVALVDAADDIEVVGTASTGLEAVRVAASARARRGAHGSADAGARRRRGHRAHRRGESGDPGRHPDHLRERRCDPQRHRGGRERLPAEGGARGGAARRRARGRRRRGRARARRRRAAGEARRGPRDRGHRR